MSPMISKFAPLAVVAAVAGYCCWSELDSPDPAPAKKGDKALEITPALLKPAVERARARDPFESGEAGVAGNKPAAQTRAAAQVARTAKEPPPGALTSALTLNATLIRGDRRVALINGKLYAEGELLMDSGGKSAAYRIASVAPDRVLLQDDSRTLELKFRDRGTRTGTSSQASRGSQPTPSPPRK